MKTRGFSLLFCFFLLSLPLFSSSFSLEGEGREGEDPTKGGFDIVVRGDALQEVQDLLTPIITNTLQTVVENTPDENGNHYTVTDFKLTTLVFSSGELYPIDGGVAYQFSIINFRVEYTVHVSFIESCTWSIAFSNNQEIPLKIPLLLDLSQEKPTFSTNPQWVVGLEGITCTQHCESFLCDANAVCLAAGGSVKDDSEASFDQGWMEIPPAIGIGLTKWIDSHFNSTSLLPQIALPWKSIYNVGLDCRGLLTAQTTTPPSGNIQSPTVYTNGGFFLSLPGDSDSSSFIFPPFSPTVTPSMLTAPPNQLSFFLTDFFFHSFIWSVEASGTLDGPIYPGMIPESSPFQLNTGNPMMRTIAPGVSSYGNSPMMCDVDVSSDAAYSVLNVTSNGIQSKNNTLLTSFYLYNTTTKEKGDLLFSLLQEGTFTVDVSLDDSLAELHLIIKVSHLKMGGATSTYSSVGRINTIAATTYTNSGLKYLQRTELSEPFEIPLPISTASFKSTPTLATTDGYLYGGGDFLPTYGKKYVTDIVVVASSSSSAATCPENYARIQQFYDSDGDFNQKGGGYYIYLCTLLDNKPGAKMLTDLSMKANKHEDDADTCPDGFSRIAQGVDSDGDFNQRAGGYWIFVCAKWSTIPNATTTMTKEQEKGEKEKEGEKKKEEGKKGHWRGESEGTGIAHIGVVAHHSKVSSACDKTSGYASKMVPYGSDSDGDYNQHAGGHWIYLCTD